MIRQISFAFLAWVCFAGASPPALAEEITIETIPQKELLSFLSEGEAFELIDARSPAEYEAGHVYGAVNIPHDSDLGASDQLPAELDQAMVVYCRSGQRAFQLKQRLEAMGYSNVRILAPTQMLWSDNLPVFNCGAEKPNPFKLQVAGSEVLQTGEDQ